MTEHSIFYYPYASFKDKQAPLLKAAALYFDKLYILDPTKASWDLIGAGPVAEDLKLLASAGILEPVPPEDVLHHYEQAITEAIRADLQDQEYLRLCESAGRDRRWTLALAKVPQALRSDPWYQPLDRSMQQLMGDSSRQLLGEAGQYHEQYARYAESVQVFDEVGMEDDSLVEFRYVDYPLALGESIMINHALFGGLLHRGATPLTDDPFHNHVLGHKIRRAVHIPEVQGVLANRARQLGLGRDIFAFRLLTDPLIKLPALSPQLPLEEILEYRHRHGDELATARRRLGQLSRQIKETSLTGAYQQDVDAALGNVDKELMALEQTRDTWLKRDRLKNILKATGLATATAATTISLFMNPTPLLPVGVAIGLLGLVGSGAVPLLELVLDWKRSKPEAMGNGLFYLMQYED